MGVPLPHLVLPLSGCLSRRTPTRATRGEARGHRSALAQNPLLMYPFFFLPLDLSSAWCVLAIWWTGPMCLRCCGCTLPGFARWRYFVDTWVAEGHTARWPWLCVLFCIASWCGCRPASGMSTSSRCRTLAHSRCQWWCDPLGHNGPCEVVCVNRGRPTHIGYPRWSVRGGRMRVRSFVIHLRVCVVAVMGLCD